MSTIIITEKSSQAKAVREAVGSAYGEILAAQGHLLALEEPEIPWSQWDFTLLRPAKGYYDITTVAGAGKAVKQKLAAIKKALKTADTVIIATDCDREGEGIGRELLDYFKYKGHAQRVIYTAVDKKSVKEAFENLKPASDFENVYQAFRARQQGDQIFNLTLTRAATKSIKPEKMKGALGIGRVKTPTLGLVCGREKEIINFKKAVFFTFEAVAATSGEHRVEMKYAPAPRIEDADAAQKMATEFTGWQGPVTVVKKAGKKSPPRLFDLPELQKICGSRHGWSASHTLDVAQSLYDTHKILTYPRAETKYLSENQINEVPTILSGLSEINAYKEFASLDNPVIRKGKSGAFCDPCLKGVSHHAIIPNAATAETFKKKADVLNKDETILFDLVSRYFIAAVSADWEFERTRITATTGDGHDFIAEGRVTTQAGWSAVVKSSEDTILPPVENNETVLFESVKSKKNETKPPGRFNEGSLIGAMQEVWKSVDDENLKKKLKEAKGIGTPATRAGVIEGLLKQKQVEKNGKKLIPTKEGLEIYDILKSTAPALLDAAITAQWELKLDEISRGEKTSEQAIDDISNDADALMRTLKKERASRPYLLPKPSEKMIAFANSIAKSNNITLADDIKNDFTACKKFLDENRPEKRAASAKQVALIKRLMAEGNAAPPKDWDKDAAAASHYITLVFSDKKNQNR